MRIGPARALGLFVFATLVVFLVRVFAIHGFCYFLLDDFNNISMAMEETNGSLIRHTLDPRSDYFRPLVLLAYRLLWNAFDLDPFPYHAFAWMLHTANVGLVYAILARITGSRYAAACGALLFAFEACYALVLWEFGGVFEACCGFLFLLGLYAHLRFGRSAAGTRTRRAPSPRR